MPLRLALYSDQECAANRPMDERLLELIGRPNPRIGYLSSAPDPQQLYFLRKQAYYAELGARLTCYADEQNICGDVTAALLDCDAIHLSGGNTFSFSRWLEQAGLFGPLREFAHARGVLIGASAGAILMTKWIATALLCGDEAEDAPAGYASLALVDFGFWPHYQAESAAPEIVAQACPAGTSVDLYACPDGSGLIVNGDILEIWGQARPVSGR